MGANVHVCNTISKYATGLSIVSIVAIFVVGLVLPKGLNWFLVMFFMICFIALIGCLRTGRLSGIFINERNLMSLSRFQLVLWTLIVLSAFLTIALARISASVADPTAIDDPLAITLPEQLWTLLGISTASLVGSPLILSTKLPKKPNPKVREAFIAGKVAKIDEEDGELIAANFIAIRKKEKETGEEYTEEEFTASLFLNTTTQVKLGTLAEVKNEENKAQMLELEKRQKKIVARVKRIGADAERKGTLNSNADIKDASFSDLFQGDEKGNCEHIDMAKVQMFFFTLIIAFSYMVLLVNLILNSDATELDSFPELSDGLVALLGISTAGYLANKPGDKTETKPRP
jgi:hypothetical protein